MLFSKRIHSIILCIIIIMITCFASTPVSAEQLPEYGVIANSSNGVRVRAEAGNFNTDVGGLATGRRVKLLGVVNVNNKDHPKWYKLQSVDFPGIIGYVSAKYVQPDAIYTYDSDFEAYLTAQKFPESYKPMLRQLHAAYPKWIFVADHLEYSWSEALSNESKVGTSLIQTPNSWKSMDDGAYNWSTNTWAVFDSGGWVAADKNVVAYYLDPRNSLNSSAVFQFLQQKYDSSKQNINDLKTLVSGTFLANSFPESTYSSYCDVIMEAAKQSGVSPYVLAAKILNEQGVNGTGKGISGNVSGYEGYYNFYSIRAYASGALDAVQNGLGYAKTGSSYMRPWNTRAKAIIGGAKWYADNYVNNGQDTFYYIRFDYGIKDGNFKRYYLDITASYREGCSLQSAYKSNINSPFVFNIPVYKNMPSEICSKPPENSGNNDYYLSSLNIGGQKYNPQFGMYNSEYEMIVDNNISQINITATTHNSGAKITGTGVKSLSVGLNVFKLTVTATSGQTKEYTLSITRNAASGDGNTQNPTIGTSLYRIGTYVTGVQPQTSVSTFKNNLNISNGTTKIFSSSGSEKTVGNVATGDDVKIYNLQNKEVYSYKIVIYGDVDGDGVINMIDMSRVHKHILEVKKVTGCYLEAANPSKDTTINMIDMSRIHKHILDVSKIAQ